MGLIEKMRQRKIEEQQAQLRVKYSKMEIKNNMYLYDYYDNDQLIDEYWKNVSDEKRERLIDILDSYGDDKWWLKKDDSEEMAQKIASVSFKLGKDNLIVYDYVLSSAIEVILKRMVLPMELEKNWDGLHKEVEQKLGVDKMRELSFTEEDWQEYEEELFKIELN